MSSKNQSQAELGTPCGATLGRTPGSPSAEPSITRASYVAPSRRAVRKSLATPGFAAGSVSRHSQGSLSRSSISSAQLPFHRDRDRSPLRSHSLRRTPASPVQMNNGDCEDEDLADRCLPEEDADALNEVIMAIDMKDNGNLGCAYYVAADEILYLLEDIAMAGVEIVETLLLHAKPTTILTPARMSEAVIDLLFKGAHGMDGDEHHNDFRGAYVLHTLKTTDFRYDAARDKLIGLQIQSQSTQTMLFTSVADERTGAYEADLEGRQGSTQGSLMRLGTSLNLESRLTIGCAGAVLGHIQRRRTAQFLPDDPGASVTFRIRSVEMFTLFNSMFVNVDTFVSLQILRSEFHPNSQMRGPSSSGAKESLSVYGLFHYLACTPQGRGKLRRIFLRPSIDIELINDRQQTISFFLRSDNTETMSCLTKDLRKIKNMHSTITNLRKGVDNPGQRASITNNIWVALQRFALHALNIRNTLTHMSKADRIPVLRGVMEVLQPLSIHQVGELISQTIDFEQSGERERTAVKQGVDAYLDEMKRRYDGMEDFLTDVNEKLRGDIPEWAKRYIQNCVFLPQLGFLTLVSLNPQTGRGDYEGEGLDDIWEQMFSTETGVYCKNRRMKEMDEQFGDAYCMIIDREIEIIHDLALRVLEFEDAILATSDVLGELDSVLALAIGCGKYNWVAPKITTENIIHIEGGRHPLQELVVPSFISNDCQIRGGVGNEDHEVQQDKSPSVMQSLDDYPSTLILTGPNHSGKSVYLKQVALIVYLAHIGCFVPAEQACVGITDRILTRIATRESVTRHESAFATDLRQAAFAINFATRRSLVLVDEFGKGTTSTDGAGLVTALLDHFTRLGLERPKLLAATHFHEIFEGNFLAERPGLAFAHMDVLVDFDTPILDNQVTFLFKLKPGRSVSSFGSRCAAMNGIDDAIVERAEALMLLLVRNEDLETACSKLSDDEKAKLEEAEVIARLFLQQNIAAPRAGTRSRFGTGDWYRTILNESLNSESMSTSDKT